MTAHSSIITHEYRVDYVCKTKNPRLSTQSKRFNTVESNHRHYKTSGIEVNAWFGPKRGGSDPGTGQQAYFEFVLLISGADRR